MDTKVWNKSRTIWLGVATVLAALVSPEVIALIPEALQGQVTQFILGVLGVGNILLRLDTTTAVVTKATTEGSTEGSQK